MRYRRFGSTGLRVSSVALGGGTFGSRWGARWSMTYDQAQRIIGTAIDSGINLIDTANVYNSGESELWIGRGLAELKARERVVVATKFGYRTDPNDVNSGGCSRRAMFAAVDGSLRRLGFDYIDLYYVHLWDGVTPVEETLGAAADLVASGKVRYVGLSNVPGWYLGAANALTTCRGWPGIAALQVNYNLAVRSAEYELIPFAAGSDIAVVTWGTLANGLLSGRYFIDSKRQEITGEGRMTETFTTGHVDPFDPVVVNVMRELSVLSEELGVPPSHLAIAWVLQRSSVSSAILGISSLEQLTLNLEACTLQLDEVTLSRLDRASARPVPYPYTFAGEDVQVLVHGKEHTS